MLLVYFNICLRIVNHRSVHNITMSSKFGRREETQTIRSLRSNPQFCAQILSKSVSKHCLSVFTFCQLLEPLSQEPGRRRYEMSLRKA